MNMDDLLNAFGETSGAQGASSKPGQQGDDPLADLLGGLMGGSDQGQPGGGDLGGLLEGLLGGGGAQDSDASPLGGLLGGLLGGGGAQQSGGSLGILGSILGGGQPRPGSQSGTDSPMGGIVQGLAEKLGLPPEIAQVVITFVLGKLLSGGVQGAQGSLGAQAAGFNLDSLMEQMGSGRGLDANYLRESGLTDELSQQTGLDPETATNSLQQVLGMLGGQMGAAGTGGQQPPTRPASDQGLDQLLDSW